MFALAGHNVSPEQVVELVGSEDMDTCTRDELGLFLDGLIVYRRGPRDPSAPVRELPPELSNNEILKKLRIAFRLQEADVLEILAAGGQNPSKSELSALFRKPANRHHRPAGDRVLRSFLVGLTLRIRPAP